MKRLSDFKGEDAILLWVDLLDYITEIFEDEDIQKAVKANKAKFKIAKLMLEKKPQACEKLLLRIDDTPLDGLNIIVRLVEVIKEVGSDPSIQSFFGFGAQKKADESSGSATEISEASEN